MIPTIATIIGDLLAGTCTKQQAIAWLNQHAEDAGYDLRDHFAGSALQAMHRMVDAQDITAAACAEMAYHIADAMMVARVDRTGERR